jgi:hypothetical protein
MHIAKYMELDIGAKKSVDGNQVFLIGQCYSSAEPPFVLLYDASKRRRIKRNIQKIDPTMVVAAMGSEQFIELQYLDWGTVWFRASRIRSVRELSAPELVTSSAKFGSLVLFEHDPEPEDQHAGFLLFGIERQQASRLLGRAVQT